MYALKVITNFGGASVTEVACVYDTFAEAMRARNDYLGDKADHVAAGIINSRHDGRWVRRPVHNTSSGLRPVK